MGRGKKEPANKKNTKNIYDVLKQMNGEDISVKDNRLKFKDSLCEDN